MAKGLSTCPHCGKSSKMIPLTSRPRAATTAGTFQSTESFMDIPLAAPTIEQRSFWANESVSHAITGIFAGGVVLIYGWWYDVANGPIVAGVILAGIVGLPILKMWWYRPKDEGPLSQVEKTVKLKVEAKEAGTIYLDEITERRVIESLSRLGNALLQNPDLETNFSKAAIGRLCKIGGRRYDAIIAEFKRLNYAFVTPNNRTVLTPRCRALLRKSATIPH